MSATPAFPFKGMTVRPDPCDGFEPALGWPGFRGCVEFALGAPEARAQFKADTGHDIDYLLKPRTGFDRLIDESTGRDGAAFAKFADWVAINMWGVESS